jgi:transposase, IS5 family
MLVTRNLQPSLWESVLPPEVRRLSPLLQDVDAWLDDEAFFDPFRVHFSEFFGRPSIPMETYLRMMFLRYYYKLGYESVCREVSDSISWRIFCRLDLLGAVPAPSTLSKITTRCGPETVLKLNEALLAKAEEKKLVKTGRVRVDTTVVEANVEYPTDSGLLARTVTGIGGLVRRIKGVGAAARTVFRDRSRSAKARVRRIGAKLKLRGAEGKEQGQKAVQKITRELAGLAEKAIADAAAVLRNARRALRYVTGHQRAQLQKAINELVVLRQRGKKVLEQARQRLGGQMPDSATRLISLHDPDARPIRKGKLGRPVEFGYKAQVSDNEDGVILDYTVEKGNPPDAPQLVPAIKRIKQRLGRAPRAVAADRGYGESTIDDEVRETGVTRVAIPRKGKPSAPRRAEEHRRGFRDLVKFRTGSEARVSQLKHRYRWDHSLVDGLERTTTWCGYGVLAHNLVKFTRLKAQQA